MWSEVLPVLALGLLRTYYACWRLTLITLSPSRCSQANPTEQHPPSVLPSQSGGPQLWAVAGGVQVGD